MVRLIAIDVDGTLLDARGQIPQANIDAIHDAVAAGIDVALVTGRSYPFVRPIAEALPSSITLIVSNGAVERGMDGSRVAQRLLNRDVARAVLESTRLYRDAAALVFDRDADRQVMFETMDWEHPGRKGYWARNQSLIAQSVPLEDALVEDPIQVMFNGGVDAMRILVEELRTRVAHRAAWSRSARGHGGRRQLQRSRNAGVRGAAGRHGQLRPRTARARLGNHRRQRARGACGGNP
jgi:haloacid dehalogenase-like hydrolase